MAITKLRITFQDGSDVDVTPTLEDTLAFETTLRKNKHWGALQDNAVKLNPFRAWNALRRNGQTELTWEQFISGDTAAVSVESITPDDNTDDDTETPVGKGGRTARRTS
jgi:hypothetical protein